MADPQLLYGPRSSILIIGASSGIGAEMAIHLARYGGKLALVARRRERLEAVAQQVRAAGAEALALDCDVSDGEAVQRIHEQLVATHGPVDVAFLNAGIGDSFSLQGFTSARVRRIFEVNLFGVLHWLELLLAEMTPRRRGTIVGVSSLAAHRGGPLNAAYCSSKAALSVLLESIRLEAQPLGIQVTVVEPGFVRSELTDQNDFPMPFLMETAPAARLICDEVAAGSAMIRFPWQTAALVRLLRTLPIPLYDRLARRMIGDRDSLKA